MNLNPEPVALTASGTAPWPAEYHKRTTIRKAVAARRFFQMLLTTLAMAPGMAVAQEDLDSIFARTTAMSVKGIDYYNLDGVEIASQQLRTSFKPNAIRDRFVAFPIGSHNLNKSDAALGLENFIVSDDVTGKHRYHGNVTTYFIKTSDTSVRAIRFITSLQPEQDFQRQFIRAILGERVPKSRFMELHADSFDFAGRMIATDGNCGWVSLNNLQCSAYGQMNWSMHKSLGDAQTVLQRQYESVLVANKVKPIADDTVAVRFEGVPVRAHRVVFSVKGLNGLITRSVGAKTLTTYYIAVPVRGRFVHCVLSHWNTAVNEESGLPLLLEQVMRLDAN